MRSSGCDGDCLSPIGIFARRCSRRRDGLWNGVVSALVQSSYRAKRHHAPLRGAIVAAGRDQPDPRDRPLTCAQGRSFESSATLLRADALDERLYCGRSRELCHWSRRRSLAGSKSEGAGGRPGARSQSREEQRHAGHDTGRRGEPRRVDVSNAGAFKRRVHVSRWGAYPVASSYWSTRYTDGAGHDPVGSLPNP